LISSVYYEKGPAAEINQDAVVYEQAAVDGVTLSMAVVCDGIGGLPQGEYASTLVTGAAREWFYREAIQLYHRKAGRETVKNSVLRMFFCCAEQMRKYGQEKEISLGTTVTMLLIHNRKYEIFHVGDSRCYLIRKHFCIQLTKDDVLKNGALSRCLGSVKWRKCQMLSGKLKKGTAFLVCSDGFRRRLTEKELTELFDAKQISTEVQLEKRLKKAGQEIISRGEKDNSTAVCLIVESGGKIWHRMRP